MPPENSLFSIIMLLGAAHGVFLGLTLLGARHAAGTGRIYLALFTLAFALDLGHEYLYQSRYLLNFLELAFIDPTVNLLYGPFLYLYARALTEGKLFKLKGWYWLHLLPVAVAILKVLSLPKLSAQQFASLYYDEAVILTTTETAVQEAISAIALSSVFSMGLYLYFSIRLLGVHAKAVRQQFSSIEKMTLHWLKSLLLAFACLYFLLLLDGFFSESLGLKDHLNKLLYFAIVVVIYAMGYMGMRQPAIFANQQPLSSLKSTQLPADSEHHEIVNTKDKKPVADSKYQRSALDSATSAVLCKDLQKYMGTEKPYLENQLNLTELATLLNITPNYLSQVINEQLHVNFFDFINGYRIEEAKSMLEDDKSKNLSIVDIAYSSGFNSKSAFYSAFKKYVGRTPSEYRRAAAETNP